MLYKIKMNENTLFLVSFVAICTVIIIFLNRNPTPPPPHIENMYNEMNLHGETRNIMYIKNLMGVPIEYKVVYDQMIAFQGVIEHGDTREIGPNTTLGGRGPRPHEQLVIIQQENCSDNTSETFKVTPYMRSGTTFIAEPSPNTCQMNVFVNS